MVGSPVLLSAASGNVHLKFFQPVSNPGTGSAFWVARSNGTAPARVAAHTQNPSLVSSALLARKPDLKIPGAALVSPTVLAKALAALASTLLTRHGDDFTVRDHCIKIGGDTWRAGLALPVFPSRVPTDRAIFQKLKNAIVFAWTHGSVLVAKREVKNVHWGKTVTGSASSQMRLHDGVRVEFTSRAANVLRDLVG